MRNKQSCRFPLCMQQNEWAAHQITRTCLNEYPQLKVSSVANELITEKYWSAQELKKPYSPQSGFDWEVQGAPSASFFPFSSPGPFLSGLSVALSGSEEQTTLEIQIVEVLLVTLSRDYIKPSWCWQLSTVAIPTVPFTCKPPFSFTPSGRNEESIIDMSPETYLPQQSISELAAVESQLTRD